MHCRRISGNLGGSLKLILDSGEEIKTPIESPVTPKTPHAIREEREHADRARQTQMVVEAAINATKLTITEASSTQGMHSREEELEESEMSLNRAITQEKKAKVELIKVQQKTERLAQIENALTKHQNLPILSEEDINLLKVEYRTLLLN